MKSFDSLSDAKGWDNIEVAGPLDKFLMTVGGRNSVLDSRNPVVDLITFADERVRPSSHWFDLGEEGYRERRLGIVLSYLDHKLFIDPKIWYPLKKGNRGGFMDSERRDTRKVTSDNPEQYYFLVWLFSELLNRGNSVVSNKVITVRDRLTVSINKGLTEILDRNSLRVFGEKKEWQKLKAFSGRYWPLFRIVLFYIRSFARRVWDWEPEVIPKDEAIRQKAHDRALQWERLFQNMKNDLFHLLFTEYNQLVEKSPGEYQQLIVGGLRGIFGTDVAFQKMKLYRQTVSNNAKARRAGRVWQRKALDDVLNTRWFDNIVVDLQKHMTEDHREEAMRLCREESSTNEKRVFMQQLLDKAQLNSKGQQWVAEEDWTDTQLCTFLGVLGSDPTKNSIDCLEDPVNVYQKTADLFIYLFNTHPEEFVIFYREQVLPTARYDWFHSIDFTNPKYYVRLKKALLYYLSKQKLTTLCLWSQEVRKIIASIESTEGRK